MQLPRPSNIPATHLAMRRIILLGLFATTSCTGWKNVTLVENSDRASRPEEIEVTSKGRKYVVHWPLVEGDSLRGWQDQKGTRPVSFALSDVQRARTSYVSAGRTMLGIGLGLALALGFWLLLIMGAGGIAPSY
jgi:hypothetical protein